MLEPLTGRWLCLLAFISLQQEYNRKHNDSKHNNGNCNNSNGNLRSKVVALVLITLEMSLLEQTYTASSCNRVKSFWFGMQLILTE